MSSEMSPSPSGLALEPLLINSKNPYLNILDLLKDYVKFIDK